MMSKKIIRSYNILDDNVAHTTVHSIPKVITKSELLPEKIINNDAESVVSKGQPLVTVNKDENGIVTSIDVTCSCGDKYSIKMEY